MSKYDRYDSVYHIKMAWLEALGGDPEGTLSDYDVSLRILDWYQSHSGGTCEHPIDIIIDVVDTISGYSGSYPMVYDRSVQKWYMLNNLDQYEEYGVMEIVGALSATTSYPGKLVVLTSDSHEYEYSNGWNDLGEVDVRYGGEFDGNSWFDTGIQAKNNLCVEYDAVVTGFTYNGGSVYGSRRGTSGANRSHGQFTDSTGLTSDLGSARNTAATNYKDKDLHYKGWLYTSGSTNNDVMWGIYCTLDGNVSFNQTGTTTGANYTTGGNGYNMFVGAMNGGGTVHPYKLKGKIKCFKIYENIDANGDGELTHDYTFVNDGGVVKMYDHITDTYFVNKGSGSVTLLPEWTPIKDYTEKDKPISSYSAETYCALYDISSDVAYVGLYGDVTDDESIYIINDQNKWEETVAPEYAGLAFKSRANGSSISMKNTSGNTPYLEYSRNGYEWNEWNYSAITLDSGDTVYFRGYGVSSSYNNRSIFNITGNVSAKGNIMSLLDGGKCTATTVPDSGFICLFSGCTGLYDVSELELPATTLGEKSYSTMFAFCPIASAPVLSAATSIPEGAYTKMFAICTSLTTAPSLPATNLWGNAYNAMFSGCTALTTAPIIQASKFENGRCLQSMFEGCTSLTTAPVLPVSSLTYDCYAFMFHGCTSLTTAPELPATKLATECYDGMFSGCTHLTSAPELPATTMNERSYESMFAYCSSLTTAPVMSATTLAKACFRQMFSDCTSLTTAPALPVTTLADECYGGMFMYCTSLVNAPALPATTLQPNVYRWMFGSCTSLTTAPELPAATLTQYCYYNMFNGCSNLNYIKCLATNISGANCTSSWVSGVSSSGAFVKDANMTGWTTGNNGIPTNWTVEDAPV